jgi:hypothetical protein
MPTSFNFNSCPQIKRTFNVTQKLYYSWPVQLKSRLRQSLFWSLIYSTYHLPVSFLGLLSALNHHPLAHKIHMHRDFCLVCGGEIDSTKTRFRYRQWAMFLKHYSETVGNTTSPIPFYKTQSKRYTEI